MHKCRLSVYQKLFTTMIMGLKKKKHVIILTICMVTSFILYQLYFFLTITSENTSMNRVNPVLDHSQIKEVVHIRSEADKFINEHGVIKGVFHQHMVKYRPDANNEFKCLNSEQHIPFDRLNDDYCDCDDETDEPSTSACTNGTFYCDTQYQKKPVSLNRVPSGKVNDGICDCCDGSDEWQHESKKMLLSQASDIGIIGKYRHYVNVCPNVC